MRIVNRFIEHSVVDRLLNKRAHTYPLFRPAAYNCVAGSAITHMTVKHFTLTLEVVRQIFGSNFVALRQLRRKDVMRAKRQRQRTNRRAYCNLQALGKFFGNVFIFFHIFVFVCILWLYNTTVPNVLYFVNMIML